MPRGYTLTVEFRMTPARLEARKQGGRALAKIREEQRIEQLQALIAIRDQIKKRTRRKPTLKEIAERSDYSERTVRRVFAWSRNGTRN